MPRGGARARSGPAPDPNALRRDRDEGEWVVLPADGGLAKAPKFPLTEETKREGEVWKHLWTSKPQAIMWERLGLELEVAMYVRKFCDAELHESAIALGTLVRQMGDSLGLTVPGMRAARWKIVASETKQASAPARSTPTRNGAASRGRFKVIPGDGE